MAPIVPCAQSPRKLLEELGAPSAHSLAFQVHTQPSVCPAVLSSWDTHRTCWVEEARAVSTAQSMNMAAARTDLQAPSSLSSERKDTADTGQVGTLPGAQGRSSMSETLLRT